MGPGSSAGIRPVVSPAGGADLLAHLAHVRTPEDPGFQDPHYATHITRGTGSGLGNRLAHQLVQRGGVQRLGHVFLDDDDLGGLALGEVFATALLILIDGITPLLEHAIEDRQHGVVVGLAPLVHLELRYLGLNHAQCSQAVLGPGRMACLTSSCNRALSDIFGSSGPGSHPDGVQYKRTRRVMSREFFFS